MFECFDIYYTHQGKMLSEPTYDVNYANIGPYWVFSGLVIFSVKSNLTNFARKVGTLKRDRRHLEGKPWVISF